MNLDVQDYRLTGLGKFNIVLGKNGCGKSTLLRDIEGPLRAQGYCRYITPERGGQLTVQGNIDDAMQSDDWLRDNRAKNRSDQFRQTSASEFRRLETIVLRKIEKDPKLRNDTEFTFDTIVDQINSLLDNVELVRSGNAFKARKKGEVEFRNIETLSSGETELISLAIEILLFAYMVDQDEHRGKSNWLFLDEPDVHIHPDLQHRLMRLLVDALDGKQARVMLATHSTSIVSALGESPDATVALMQSGQKELAFERIDGAMQAILPIFGAHPLSNVFNDRPILLVEGEDDERIWQQAARSSQGRVKIWPCVAGSVQDLNTFELRAQTIIAAVYDDAVAYSLRDRDDDPYEIDDVGTIRRARLECRAAENLLLSNDVLALLGTDWDALIASFDRWIDQNDGHPQAKAFATFKESGWDRRRANVKSLRNIIMALAGSEKPWEVAIGQAVSGLLDGKGDTGKDSLTDYLGPKLVEVLTLSPQKPAVAKRKTIVAREPRPIHREPVPALGKQ